MALRVAARRAMANLARPAQLQQKRFVGDLPVKPNKYVEEWATRREHLEFEFKWDRKTLTSLAVFGVVLPFTFYHYTIAEYNHADDKAGRPRRDMWGSSK